MFPAVGMGSLDLTFDAKEGFWSGTLMVAGKTTWLRLVRPYPPPSATKNPMVGSWESVSAPPAEADFQGRNTCLHVFQGWSDPFFPQGRLFVTVDRPLANEKLYGEELSVDTLDERNVSLVLTGGVGPTYFYRGSVSDDGSLHGSWGSTGPMPANYIRSRTAGCSSGLHAQ